MDVTKFEAQLDQCGENGDNILALIPQMYKSDIITCLVAAYCTAKKQESKLQTDFLVWVQTEKTRVSHENDHKENATANYFDFHRRIMKQDSKKAKKALLEWWQENVDHISVLPKTELELERHYSSDRLWMRRLPST